jgi:hypothetical protein
VELLTRECRSGAVPYLQLVGEARELILEAERLEALAAEGGAQPGRDAEGAVGPAKGGSDTEEDFIESSDEEAAEGERGGGKGVLEESDAEEDDDMDDEGGDDDNDGDEDYAGGSDDSSDEDVRDGKGRSWGTTPANFNATRCVCLPQPALQALEE